MFHRTYKSMFDYDLMDKKERIFTIFNKTNGEIFDWFDNEIEVEEEQITKAGNERSVLSEIFDIAVSLIVYSFVILVLTRTARFLFADDNLTFLKLNVNMILNISIIFLGTFLFIILLVKILSAFLEYMNLHSIVRKFDSVKRLIILLLWLTFSFFKIKFVKTDVSMFYVTLKKVLFSGMITTATYTLGVLAMIWFEDFFVKKSLRVKIKETEKTERVLKALKNYRYDITDNSDSDRSFKCSDLFCIDLFEDNSFDSLQERNDYETDAHFANVTIKPPEIHKIHDAMTLARDVFTKASSNETIMPIEDFCKIFKSNEDAFIAYPFFDSDQDRVITRKEFRDVILHFYKERVLLEKSVESSQQFVTIIRRIFYSLLFILLFIAYLVIFGIPFTELMALVLSSALALNFFASGMFNDTYKNIVVLLSHQYDIGDEVLVNGEDLTVYNIGLSSTAFLSKNGGTIKMLNSDIWSKSVINMTKAPEKIIVFTFHLPTSITTKELQSFKSKMSEFLKARFFDFHSNFVVCSSDGEFTGIDVFKTTLKLRFKGFKNKSKKFLLRIEVTAFIKSVFEEMNINTEVS
jgi:small-conductance mechanosensitive channel